MPSFFVPTPGNLPTKAKKMPMPGGQPGGGGGGGARRRWNCLMHNRILEPVHEFRMYSQPPFSILNVGKGFDMSF